MISAVITANAGAHARGLGALTPPVGGETATKMAIPDPTPSSPMMLFRMSGRLFLGSLTGMRRMVARSAWYPGSAADQSAPHRPGHAADADPRGGQDRSLSPESSRANADARLPVASLGRVQGGGG